MNNINVIKQDLNYNSVAPGKEPLMLAGSESERINAFFDFLEMWDVRDDKWLSEQEHQFSHRLHWNEAPFFQQIREYASEHTIDDAINLLLIFCFTVENNELYDHLRKVHPSRFRYEILNWPHPIQRSDLFQLWLPKGCKLRELLVNDVDVIASWMTGYIDGFTSDGLRLSMMEAKKSLQGIVSERTGWTRCSYAVKNAVRHIAMAFPSLIDPDGYIKPGTGSYQGFRQVFAGPFLMSKSDELIQAQFTAIRHHPRANIFECQHNINIEDKMCFFFKWLGFESGYRKPKFAPKRPQMIIQEGFSLKK